MRRYESVVILEPEMADDDIKNFTEKYTTLIKTNGGEIIKVEDWGFKRLAYRVKKRDRGRYLLFDFVGVPAVISELERQFKISEEVMKFLSVKVDDEVDLEAFQAAAQVSDTPPESKESETVQPVEAPEPGPVSDDGGPTAGETDAATGDQTGLGLAEETPPTTNGDAELKEASPEDASVEETHKEGL